MIAMNESVLATEISTLTEYQVKQNVVIPLAQPNRCANGNGQPLKQAGTKGTAAEAETVLIQIGLEIIFGQTVVSTQNKCLRVADGDV